MPGRESDWNLSALTEAGLLDPPDGWAFGGIRWREIHAHQMWCHAGQAWLAERGHYQRARWHATKRIAGVDYEPSAS